MYQHKHFGNLSLKFPLWSDAAKSLSSSPHSCLEFGSLDPRPAQIGMVQVADLQLRQVLDWELPLSSGHHLWPLLELQWLGFLAWLWSCLTYVDSRMITRYWTSNHHRICSFLLAWMKWDCPPHAVPLTLPQLPCSSWSLDITEGLPRGFRRRLQVDGENF